MLYQMLEDRCRVIEGLDVETEAPRMRQQIENARPDFREGLLESLDSPDTYDSTANAIARGILMFVREIPELARAMADLTQNHGEPAAMRCAMAGTLAYLVQPRDLIPDDAPGGYGYVDDGIVVKAAFSEALKTRPHQVGDRKARAQYIETLESQVNFAARVVPTPVLPLLQMAVEGIGTTVQILAALPDMLAELTLQQIVANPLQATTPAPPAGFQANPVPSYGTGHWGAGGAYFEDGNVIMPGGPSLIDGQLFIP